MFSAHADASYMHSVEDKDYYMSLNYYEYTHGTAKVEISGMGPDQVLNATGKSAYSTPENRKLFGITCGDSYVDSYDVGALLIMSMNINFNSHKEKTEFQADMGASFGSLASVSVKIEQTAKKYNMHGTVSIQAYQKGGQPNQLSKIIDAKDPSGKYYILTCDLQNMDACAHAAGGLYDYAGGSLPTDFPQQVSYDGGAGKGLVPLGTGWLTHTSIAALGLAPPASLVTDEVKANREYLADVFKENQYYQQKLHELLYGYPVKWNTDSDIYKGITALSPRVDSNVDAILPPGDPEDGALACYDNLYPNDPHNCSVATKAIKNYLITDKHGITADDVKFLDVMKTAYPICNWEAMIYYVGGRYDSAYPNMSLDDFVLTSNHMKVAVTVLNDPTFNGQYFFDASTKDGHEYTGHCWDTVKDWGSATGFTATNPFYFTIYKPQKSKAD